MRDPLPTKEDIKNLEPFVGLPLDKIHLVATKKQASKAIEAIRMSGVVGFDTEAKPTFRKGQQSTGPHVLQFATMDEAFIFQTHHQETFEAILEILSDSKIHKIGFGLSGDRSQISNKFGITPNSMIDLDHKFKHQGYRNSLGVRTAVALLMNQKFSKSKSTTTSNWAAKRLSDRQLLYAANDAYAALCVHEALEKSATTSDQ